MEIPEQNQMSVQVRSEEAGNQSGAKRPRQVLILGAGPAGLGAGYELARHGVPCTILDKNSQVGGLARTMEFKGFRFDVGPHRFFTKEKTVQAVWEEVLGRDLLRLLRLTRIYYRGKFFFYPLKPLNALIGLGIGGSLMTFGSYLYARIVYRCRQAKTFEQWITYTFGRRLYEAFFKTYTEKVWGVSCSDIGAEWAAQRIRGLNLWRVVKTAILGNRQGIRTLTDQFCYPRIGAGMLYEKMSDKITTAGGRLHLGAVVEAIEVEGTTVTGVRCADGRHIKVGAEGCLLSSIPITAFVQCLTPQVPTEVLAAARGLRYRDHITVNLTYFGTNPFPDNWIYVHAGEVRMARITNYANFSRDMVPTEDANGLAVEYFCFENDDLWRMSDEALVELATEELMRIGLIRRELVRDGFVLREKNAYPAYYAGYQTHFETLKNYVSRLTNVHMIGRAGMFKYGNQDHAMLTGLLTARNVLGEQHDVWSVHDSEEYIEEESHRAATVAEQ
ncbi:MAG: FAD-dependent oxidoreductase [Verrucomicrobiia bacterium]